MIEVKKLDIDGKEFEGVKVFTGKVYILLIKAEKGFLGCGYFNVDVADKFDDVMAVVTGVKSFDDMLNALIVKASKQAKALGIKEGVSGKEALKLMS